MFVEGATGAKSNTGLAHALKKKVILGTNRGEMPARGNLIKRRILKSPSIPDEDLRAVSKGQEGWRLRMTQRGKKTHYCEALHKKPGGQRDSKT